MFPNLIAKIMYQLNSKRFVHTSFKIVMTCRMLSESWKIQSLIITLWFPCCLGQYSFYSIFAINRL